MGAALTRLELDDAKTAFQLDINVQFWGAEMEMVFLEYGRFSLRLGNIGRYER